MIANSDLPNALLHGTKADEPVNPAGADEEDLRAGKRRLIPALDAFLPVRYRNPRIQLRALPVCPLR